MSDQDSTSSRSNPSTHEASAQVVTPIGARIGDVKAETLIIRQGAAQTIEASNVTIRQGAALQLKAETAEIVQGGAVLAQTEKLTLGPGAAALGVLADSVTMDQSLARAVISRGPMGMEQSGAIAVIAPQASVRASLVGLLFARHVEGDVQTIFGPRAAVAFGAAFGAAFGVAFALASRLGRRRKR